MDSRQSNAPNIRWTLATAKVEDYDFKVALDSAKDAASEHVVVVRVYDKYDNMGAAKTVLKGK